jgi:DNA polymerase
MKELHMDFETRSTVDLKKHGLSRYADPSQTEVICMAWAFDEYEPVIWLPDGPMPTEITEHIHEGGTVVAHNAIFEFRIWNNILVPLMSLPSMNLEQMDDTMARAYAMSLPGSLDGAAKALGIDANKDMEGHRLMLRMSRPRRMENEEPIWWTDDPKMQRLYAYCLQDVRVEQKLHKKLFGLSRSERQIWNLDQTINLRGVEIDAASCRSALSIIRMEAARLNAEMHRTTGGYVTTCNQVGKLTEWVGLIMPEIKWEVTLAKADIASILDDAVFGAIDPRVREALLLRQEASRASTAKIKAMLNVADKEDNRIRHMFQYHGASTGRWAGRKVQLHNIMRPLVSQEVIDDVLDTRLSDSRMLREIGKPMEIIASSLRGLVRAEEGMEFMCADFSSIEARMLAWLAGQESALEVFRRGEDIYLHAAREMGQERFIGKVATLSLGYGGGKIAFQKMCTQYGLKLEESRCESIKNDWRRTNASIVEFWKVVQKAAIQAVQNDGTKVPAGRCTFMRRENFLWCQLPSGRTICYPFPEIRKQETPWGDMVNTLTYMGTNPINRKWERISTYGGKLVENITQGAAACVLREAMLRLEEKWFIVVMHVHDEVVVESPIHCETLKDMIEIMTVVPEWAEGLPIDADGWRGKRYRK